MKFRSLLFVLLVLITLISASAQDSASGTTSAGDNCMTAEEVDKKMSECQGTATKKTDSTGCTIVECYTSGNSAGTTSATGSSGTSTAGGATDSSGTGDECPDEDIDAGKTAECEASGMYAVSTTDEKGCKMIVCKEYENTDTTTGTDSTASGTSAGTSADGTSAGDSSTGTTTTASSTTDTTTSSPTTSTDSNTCPTEDEVEKNKEDCEAKGGTANEVVNLYGCDVIDCKEPESTGTDSGTSTDSTSTDTEDDSTDDTTTESTDCDEDIDDGKFEECTNNGMYAVTDIDPVSGCKIVICKESLTDDTTSAATDTTYDCPSDEEISSVKESCEEKEYQYAEGIDDKGCKFGMCKEPETGEIGEVTEFETTCTISKDKECVKITCDEVGFTHVSCKDEEPMDSSQKDVPYDDKKPATKIGEWIKGFFKSDDKGAGDVMGLEKESATTAG